MPNYLELPLPQQQELLLFELLFAPSTPPPPLHQLFAADLLQHFVNQNIEENAKLLAQLKEEKVQIDDDEQQQKMLLLDQLILKEQRKCNYLFAEHIAALLVRMQSGKENSSDFPVEMAIAKPTSSSAPQPLHQPHQHHHHVAPAAFDGTFLFAPPVTTVPCPTTSIVPCSSLSNLQQSASMSPLGSTSLSTTKTATAAMSLSPASSISFSPPYHLERTHRSPTPADVPNAELIKGFKQFYTATASEVPEFGRKLYVAAGVEQRTLQAMEAEEQQQQQQHRPHKCDQCQKSFRFKSNLFEHKSLHLGLAHRNPFVCPFCAKTCRLKGNLKKHLQVHVSSIEDLERLWKRSFSRQSGRPRKNAPPASLPKPGDDLGLVPVITSQRTNQMPMTNQSSHCSPASLQWTFADDLKNGKKEASKPMMIDLPSISRFQHYQQ